MSEYTFIWENGGWWLKIDSMEGLEDYFKHDSRWTDAFTSLIHSKEFVGVSPVGHASTLALCIGMHGVNNHMTPISATVNFEMMVFQQMAEAIEEDGAIAVNQVGGYHSVTKNDYDQWVKRPSMVFPDFEEKDIRIQKFNDMADHWYVYVGNMEVRNSDGSLWKTEYYEKAVAKARQYIEKGEDD